MIELPDFECRIGDSGFAEAYPIGELMNAKECRIAWKHDERGRVSSVFITDDFALWLAREQRFEATGGRCYTDWMKPTKDRSGGGSDDMPDQLFSPLGTYSTMVAYGFASIAVHIDTLKQFAAMDSCSWARQMLFALSGELNPKDIERPG